MRRTTVYGSVALLSIILSGSTLAAGDGNRLAYLDGPCDPYYPGRRMAKLVTPQWVGEPGVEAVIVLSIDDLSQPAVHQKYLRPILDRLAKIDGRGPVSLMANRIDPKDPQLQKWLQQGVSLEAHTLDHPGPLLQGGDLAAAKRTYDGSVDLMTALAGNRPLAYRMPCCDSMSSVSPRFFTEIFGKTTPEGNFLAIDSSVFMVYTANDPELPRPLVFDADGRERFRKYVPTDRIMANLVYDYPYPYVIDHLCWEIPALMPSDWDAQHLNRVCSPKTVADLKAAVDATVIKQGIFALCFHTHGWIRNDQIIEMIDHAVAKHGKKVKFLTFREVYDRLTKNLLGGHPLRAANGQDNGVRVLDLDNDAYMDVVVGNEKARQTRRWLPETAKWAVGGFPCPIVQLNKQGGRHSAAVCFGVVQRSGFASFNSGLDVHHFSGRKWSGGAAAEEDVPLYRELPKDDGWLGYRLLDVDGDGVCEIIGGVAMEDVRQSSLVRWSADQRQWEYDGRQLPLPAGVVFLDHRRRDAGARFVDIDEDGRLDIVLSDARRYSIHLFTSMEKGWSRCVLSGKRGDGDPRELPPFVRADGTNNGAWFADRHLWVQNEDTGGKLPGHVFGRHFTQLLDADHQPPARSPQGSLKAMLPRPGFKVELMAAEPLVADPVDIAWGPDGKAWVTEMADYPLGIDEDGHIGLPDPPGVPGGRIRFLEDSDRDGRYDRSTVFLEPVGFPSGVMPWRKGVIVTAAPEIFYAEDTDGDGKADTRKTLFKGFGQGNQQHRVNHPRWGLDNWVHAANGDSNGTITSLMTGKATDISGRDLRFRPDQGLLQPQTGQAQFGRNRDDWGNWFGCNNNNPGWHYVLADHYLRRNPHLPAPSGRLDVTSSRDSYPGGRVVTHCYYDQPTPPEGQPGRWTSIGGVMIYRDDLFGLAYAGNLFVDDSVYGVIHRLVLTPQGLTFRGQRAPGERRSEFLASSDPWFRPTTLRTGPDGALWVVDMYRFVIEHPEWIDDRLEKTLELRRGHDRGRIYRIFPIDKRPRPIPRLDRLDTAGLVAALDSPSGWRRDMAQQMLIWRADMAAVEPLEKMALGSKRPQARLHAMCALDGLGGLRAEIALRALGDKHPGVRRHAVRVSESVANSSPALGEALVKMVGDPDPQVRLQVAYSLGEWDDPRAGRALGRMAIQAAGDPYLTAAVMSSATGQVKQMIAEVQAHSGKVNTPGLLLHELLKLLDAVQADPDATAADFEPIRVRAEKPLRDPVGRKKIERALEKFKPVIEINGDPVQGKKTFVEATCSVCHRLEDVGTRIGPDIRTLIDRSPGNLMVAVIDPSRAFLKRYTEYTVVTADGLQHGGMMMDQTSNSILLADADGKQHVLLRKDLQELVDTGRSHMPEGLYGKLTPQKMADLFAFVSRTESARKQFPGNDPRPIRADADGCLLLTAATAEIYGPGIVFEPKYRNIGWWSNDQAYVSWSIDVPHGAPYEVWLEWACQDGTAGKPFLIQAGLQKFTGKVPGTGTWDDYRRAKFGRLQLQPGSCRFGMRSDGPISGALIDLRAIRLVPVPEGRTVQPGRSLPPDLGGIELLPVEEQQ